MRRLRIKQSELGEDRYKIDLDFEGDGGTRQKASAEFEFRMTPQDQSDLRWYLEDSLQLPYEPEQKIAARIEGRISELGTTLFRSVFQADDDTRDLWATLRQKLDDTIIEVITSVEAASSIPWELIRDPKTDDPLALGASSFIRAQPNPARRPELPKLKKEAIRILLVICRPGADQDVPFRSVASRLIKGLSEEARATFQLDVLRPPTFEQLAKILRQAKSEKKPYHIVHFDGHGMYATLGSTGSIAEHLQKLYPVVYAATRTGKHGFLVFENPNDKENSQLVDGPSLGKLLVETDVPVLVLNACRSAHAEAETEPETEADTESQTPDNPHAQVRAIGSFAQEVMDAGVAGVVAMRYNVYVVTAAQFVADLYGTLVRGQTLGAAVSMGRKQLAVAPQRTIAYDPRPLQDWCVPIVYEAAPSNKDGIALFPKVKEKGHSIKIEAGDTTAQRGTLDENLPKPPDVGFFGRDETLLALDRAFDTQSIVLLHAYAGSGKTATSAEFARWYAMTGGVEGPVLFNSFERYIPLPRVLDSFGKLFGPMLEQVGVQWLALNDKERRTVVLQVLEQVPVLWIWDNIEPIAGFPEGTKSAWSEEEQGELLDFLRDAKETKAKFLLTSRRDERKWLGEQLPRRVQIGPMPMQERVQLTRGLAEKHGRRITDVNDWRPLLRFTNGNPLTITALVGQALRDGLRSKEQIAAFVSQLRAGEAKFDDDEAEGRSKSLGASLNYGFEHAFNEEERKQLALLHLFQGFVSVVTLQFMGDPEDKWCLPAVRGLTREAGIALLDRAAEVGLLTSLGGGFYTIHPAVPWFFKDLFTTYYPEAAASSPPGAADATASQAVSPTRAFVEAIGELGNFYWRQYNNGNRDVLAAVSYEEANLLHARRLARQHGWWNRIIDTMQGLRNLYDQTGRRAEWARLVEEIVPDFMDPASDGPRPGLEEEWGLVAQYRVRLAQEQHQWAEAERLQRLLVIRLRQRVEELVVRLEAEAGRSDSLTPPGERAGTTHTGALPPLPQRLRAVITRLPDSERNSVRSLAASLHELGRIQLEQEEAACAGSFQEAFDLAQQIDDRALAAICAFNLGTAYKDVSSIRAWDQAEQWYRRSLELRDPQDRQGRGQVVGQLGSVAYERFEEARAAQAPIEEQATHLTAALTSYGEALELLPANAVDDRAVTHNQLGNIYDAAGDLDRALTHYRESIQYDETANNHYGAAQTRYNVARALTQDGRWADARTYAVAARDGFARYEGRAADMVQLAEELIALIDQDIANQGTK